jgi:hypothetical protein
MLSTRPLSSGEGLAIQVFGDLVRSLGIFGHHEEHGLAHRGEFLEGRGIARVAQLQVGRVALVRRRVLIAVDDEII